MVWKRPEHIEYPKVWHRFQGRKPMPDGSIPTFRVQDLPEDRFEDAKNFMASEFLHDEPCCRALDAGNDESMIRQMKNIWTKCLQDKVALVCFREDPSYIEGVCPDIVGMNVTCIAKVEEKGYRVEMTGEIFPHIMGTVYHTMEMVDIFEAYGVSEYMMATGLSVSKHFRGQNIGAEILRARIPLCKAIGIKVTSTAFSAIESQVLAKKVGFKDEAEITYDDLREKHGYALAPMSFPKTMKLMTMKIE